MRRAARRALAACRGRVIVGVVVSAGLVCGALPVAAQGAAVAPEAPAFVARAWTVDDGLPSNAVSDAAQGRDGYLWLTTYAGLVRFDGVRFTTFTSETTPALPTDRLLGFFPARDGALWIRTEALAIVYFDPVRMTLVRIAAGLEGAQTRVVLHEADGTLWAGTDAGLFRRQGRRFVRVGGVTGSVFGLARDGAGALWAGTTVSGVYRLHGGRVQRFTAADGLPAEPPTVLAREADGAIRVGRPDALRRYEGGRLVPVPPRTDGAPRWSFAGGEVRLGDHRVFEAGSPIRNLARDREGNLWVATQSNGLIRLRPALFTVYGEPEGLADRHVYTLLEDRTGALWFSGLTNGISRLHEDRVEVWRTPRLPSGFVTATYEDDRGQLWIGHDRGVCRVDGARCEPVPDLDLPPVQAILQDRGGAFWIASDWMLCRWTEGQPRRCLTPASGLPDARIRILRVTADGTLWVGTEGGLVRLRDGRLRVFTTADGLSGDVVRALHEDASGALWVGTGGRGLSRLTETDREQPRIRTIRAADGLPDDVVYALVEDAQGRLWMSTNRGIGWARRADLDAFADGRAARVHATLYTEADGLRNREGNGSQRAALQARDGRLWFATQDGAAAIDPRAVALRREDGPVVIEGVTTGGTAWSARQPVRLASRQRDFEIAYTALEFAAPEAVRFRYRLDGFDPAWVEAGARRTAFYTNVPPGEYTFRVMARRRDGRWTEAPTPLRVSVAPFAWETAWFRALAMLLLLGAGAGAVQWRTRVLRRRGEALRREVALRTRDLTAANAVVTSQAERLREMDAAKNRLFANLSHEFRTPLTLILGPLESGAEGAYGPVPEPIRARDARMLRNGRRLLRLVNQVLDLARLEAGQMQVRPERHDLPAFVRQTALAFVPLAERQGLALTVEAEQAPPTAVFDREQMERVLGNLLSNALKFTPPGGTVGVTCRRVDGDLDGTAGGDGAAAPAVEIVVADTGVGIPPEHLAHVFDRFFQVDATTTRAREGSGIGLALAKELVELHGGTLTAASEPGGGSRFTVRLPHVAEAPAPPQPESDAPPALDVELHGAELSGAMPADAAPELPAEADAPETAGAEHAPKTVLVVDDNLDLRAYLRSVLAPDYRVVEAADGAEGLARTREALPDLVVADVMMPVMDGLALARALRADPATEGIPVVLLTARSATEDEVAGLETGADDYVRKPFSPEVLRGRVRNLIALRERLRERLRAEGVPAPETSPDAAPDPPFTARVRAAVLAHLTDGEFTVERLAAELTLSYSQLHRRLTAEGSAGPLEFMRTVRLEAAARLLRDAAGTVSEVAYATGFNSLAHFSRAFRAHFGTPPSAYAASVREGG